MAHLVGPEGRVVGIELLPDLAAQSRADLEALSFGNATIITGDGTRGHAAGAPYHRAIITAATWDVPAVLLDQVAWGGRILVPVELKGGDGCDVTVLQRQGAVLVAERSVPGWFVPLQGGGQDRRADALTLPPAGEAKRTMPGRGTSTHDSLAIAQACPEHPHDVAYPSIVAAACSTAATIFG